MRRHDHCMVETLALEAQIYGKVMSPSVLDRVRELDEAMRLRLTGQYGGSRSIPAFKSPPPPPKPSKGGPTKASGS